MMCCVILNECNIPFLLMMNEPTLFCTILNLSIFLPLTLAIANSVVTCYCCLFFFMIVVVVVVLLIQ